VKFLYDCSSQEDSRLNYMILVQLEPIFECLIHPNNVLKNKQKCEKTFGPKQSEVDPLPQIDQKTGWCGFSNITVIIAIARSIVP